MASEMQMRDIERFDEFRNKCLGHDKCEDCPRYLDDCDGVEEE